MTTIRDATPDDLPLYAQLFVELGLDQPPSTRIAELLPGLQIAERGAARGFVLSAREGHIGLVRQIVVDPTTRRAGMGRALMHAAMTRLRSQGARRLRLNVKSDNAAAIALYHALGLSLGHRSSALWIDRRVRPRLPCSRSPLVVYAPEARADAELERAFELPENVIVQARAHGSLVRAVRIAKTSMVLGLMRYSPSVPGAFPFCARSAEAARALLADAEQLTPIDAPKLSVVVSDGSDGALTDALVEAGAVLRFHMLQMEGPL